MKSSCSSVSFRRSMLCMLFVLVLAEFISFFGTATAVYADTFTVTTTSDDVSDSGSLRYAINNVTSQDVITFDLEYPAIITLSEQLSIDKGLKIQGPGADLLAVSGGGKCRVFYVESTDELVDISGIAIVSGDAGSDSGGGGICNLSDNFTITSCTFSSNRASAGGGMFNYGSDSTVMNCTFLSNNSEGPGAGMCNSGSDLTVTNCTFSSNNSADVGGGMYNQGSSPTMTNCTFSENSAVFGGGGMFNKNSSPTVTNCTFDSNNSGWQGGGIYNEESSPEVINCIFWNNPGGEIDNSETTSGFPTLRYCVIQSNDVGEGTISNDIISADPLLQDLAENGGSTWTCALGEGSSAIDAGATIADISTDQRGVDRPQGTSFDIGAYEAEIANDDENGDGCNISALSGIGLLLVAPLMFLLGKMK